MIMDRILEKKKGWRRLFTRKALPLWAAGAFVLLLAWMIAASGHKVRRVEAESLRIGEVTQGEFDDYISVSGTVYSHKLSHSPRTRRVRKGCRQRNHAPKTTNRSQPSRDPAPSAEKNRAWGNVSYMAAPLCPA